MEKVVLDKVYNDKNNLEVDGVFIEVGTEPGVELAQKIGVGRVYLQHLIRLHDILKGHQKRMLFWGDIALQHPELLAEIPQDIIVANWGYAAVPSFENQLKPYAEVGLDYNPAANHMLGTYAGFPYLEDLGEVAACDNPARGGTYALTFNGSRLGVADGAATPEVWQYPNTVIGIADTGSRSRRNGPRPMSRPTT